MGRQFDLETWAAREFPSVLPELKALRKATTEITIHSPTSVIPNKVSIERLLYRLYHRHSVALRTFERNVRVRPNLMHCIGQVPVRCSCEWYVRHPTDE